VPRRLMSCLLDPAHATEGGADGFLSAARRSGYQGRFLVVADAADARKSALAIRLGASGTFLTSEAPDRLVRAITLVANGGIWLDPAVIQLLADQSVYRPLQMDDWKSRYLLSDRQQKVLLGILEGLTNGKIAANLGVSESISMRPHATRQEIDHVCERIRDFGYKVHSIEGEERVVIGVVGVGDVTACLESLEATPGVESAVRISAPYKFVSKEFKKERGVIRVNGVEIGGDEFVVMAGPCSVESEKQIMETAEGVAAAGARMLRGGAFKPRTSPYDFQGMELEGLKLLRKAKEATGLAIVTEIMSDRDVDLVAEYADMHAGGRAQHAELRAAEIAGRLRPSGAAEARHEFHHQGTADVGRIHGGARQSQRDSVRARHPHV
jgi:hypothetical protein